MAPDDNAPEVERDHKAFMDALYWWGVPTLFRCPHNTDPTACDIGLVGVPHSTGNGTTEHDLSDTWNVAYSGRTSYGASLPWRTGAGSNLP